MLYTSSGKTVSVYLDDATQFATVRQIGTDKPIGTLERSRVLDKSFHWKLYDRDGCLVYTWRLYCPRYQELTNSVGRILAR